MTTEIDWRQNCLTGGPHDGRPGVIWNLPLLYAATILYRKDELKEIVISRIYSDAMMLVDHGPLEEDGITHILSKEWADRVKEDAKEHYDRTLQHKIGELSKYYETHGWRRDVHSAVAQIHNDRLNRGYEPLHSHDSINMLCRILGVSAARKAG